MSRRKVTPLKPRAEALERRQMLSGDIPPLERSRPRALPSAWLRVAARPVPVEDLGTFAWAVAPRPRFAGRYVPAPAVDASHVARRPDLDEFARALATRPRLAARMGLGEMSRWLRGHAAFAARHGWGACLVMELEMRPAYAARTGLNAMLRPATAPTPAPPAPAPVVPATPPTDNTGGGVDTPTLTTLVRAVQVGDTLRLSVPSQGLTGPDLSFTITPQPLPANMTFNRGTGELAFAPAPGQEGRFDLSVTVSDGKTSTRVAIPITVARTPRPSTEVTGRVVDEAGRALARVPVSLGGAKAITDENGSFTLRGVAADPGPLDVDGLGGPGNDRLMVMAPVTQFLGHALHPNVTNTVPDAIVLPRIDLANATDFGRLDPSKPQVLTSPRLPGFEVRIAPDSARVGSGERFTGKIALTQLDADQVARVLPPGVRPGALFVGVDGPGLMFTEPAKVTFPNQPRFAPGTLLRLMSMDMVSGAFQATGTLRVTDDGASIETIAGGFHGSSCLFPEMNAPGPGVPLTTCLDCQATAGGVTPPPNTYVPPGEHYGPITHSPPSPVLKSDVGLVTGAFYEDHPLVSYQSQGASRGLELQYNSLHADPRPVIQQLIQIQPNVGANSLIEILADLELESVSQGATVTYDATGLAGSDKFRVALQADATALSTGIYQASLNVGLKYTNGELDPITVSASYTVDDVAVVNASASPYGAGWSIGGVQRIHGTAGDRVLVTAGAQGNVRFDYYPAGPVKDLAVVTSSGLRILSNDGWGHFTEGSATSVGTATAMAPGDFDGDGKADVAIVGGTTLAIYLANNSGGFTAGNTYTLADDGAAVLAGNYTGHTNGVLDLAVLRADGVVTVYTGNGSGGFSSPTSTTVGGGSFGGTGSMAAGDFDSDGDLDLAVASTGDGVLRVLPGNGSGGFGSATSLAVTYGSQFVAAGDLTGDGKADLALIAGTTRLYLFKNNGSGGFSQTGFYETDGSSHPGFNGVQIADYRGTGVGHAAVSMIDSQGGMMLIPGSGTGAWGEHVFHPTVVGNVSVPPGLATADVNGDGKPDLVVANGDVAPQVLASHPDSNQMEEGVTLGGSTATLVAAAAFTNQSLGTRYVAPMGDTSTLVRNTNGTWTRTYIDGTVVAFDSDGRQTSVTDRNGNATTFTYITTGAAAGALQAVIDPVGLRTTLAYNGSGKLSTITDPAGRVTTVTVDGSGNLTAITDPDGAGRQYSYNAARRMTGSVDPRGGIATITYDSFGRFASETLPGNLGTTSVSPAEVQGLLAPGGSGAYSSMANYKGSVVDPNNNRVTLAFDTMGHPDNSSDALGNTTTFARNMNGWATAVTDPLSRTTSYAYDARGNVTEVTRPDNTSMAIAYDATFSRPTRVEDFLGRVTTFTLDAEGNVTRRTDPDLDYEDFTYDGAGQVLTRTDRNGHTTSLAYDALGRLTTVTYPGAGSPQVRFNYDSAGNVTSVVDELGRRTTYTYDPANRVKSVQNPVQAASGKATSLTYDASGNLTVVQDALDRRTTSTYDARDRLRTVTDPLGRVTTFTYDGRNRIAETDPLGHTTTYLYDAANRPTGRIDPLGNRTTWTYDAAHQLRTVVDPNNNTTTYTFDSVGRLASRQLPGTAPGPYGSTVDVITTYTYDDNDNRIAVTDALYHTTTFSYDVLNRLVAVTDALNHTTTLGYDEAGNQTTVTDPLGHVTTYAFDARDRLVTETRPSGGGTTTYAYDAASRLTGLTDPVGNVTAWAYDDADRVTTETDPRGKVTTFTYDLVDNLTGKVDRLNRATSFAYDAADRRTAETWYATPGGSLLRTVTYTYDNADRTTGVVDPDSQYAYGYDAADRLTTVNNNGSSGVPQVTLTYGYDNAGNRTSVADSLGGLTTYTYDVRDQLTQIRQSGTGVTAKRVDLAYDAALRRTTLTRYSDLAGTATVLVTKSGYDAADRLTNLSHETAGGTARASYGYTLDAASRLTSEARTWASGSSTDTVSYTYTNDDQLTGVTHTNGSFASESFSFDSNGNRTMTGYTTGTGNRLTADGTFTYAYDDEGNLTSKTEVGTGNQTLYSWDHRNRLTAVDSKVGGVTTRIGTYTYDALDRRIKVVANGATRATVYDGDSAILDFNGSGTQTARYLQGPVIDEILAREVSGTVAWYLQDRLNTVRDIVDNAGALIDHIDYQVFGKVAAESSPGNGDRWKYTGRELDPETDLYQYRSRYYDAAAGRFVSEDRIGFAGGDANLYRYTSNNCLNNIDPRGTRDWGSWGGKLEISPLLPTNKLPVPVREWRVLIEKENPGKKNQLSFAPLRVDADGKLQWADAVIIPGKGLLKIRNGDRVCITGWDYSKNMPRFKFFKYTNYEDINPWSYIPTFISSPTWYPVGTENPFHYPVTATPPPITEPAIGH